MRRLLLLRHAKAAPSDGRDDFDRELTEAGRIDARRLGEFLVESDLIPDLVVYSGARRTRETAAIIGSAFPQAVRAHEENSLYEATRYLILALLRDLPDAARTILVVGHNPGIADIANQLAGEGAKDERQRIAHKYPTSGLAVLHFATPRWADLELRGARLERFVTPADLGLRGS